MNVLLLSMPDSFEHMPPVAIRMPNGALASLAGNVDRHHRVAAADLILARNSVNATIERLLRDVEPDVVGLSVMTFQRATALGIARRVRALRPSARLVVGGYDPSLAPEAYERCPEIDFIVRGEGEQTFRELLRVLEREETRGATSSAEREARGAKASGERDHDAKASAERVRDIGGLSYRVGDRFVRNASRPVMRLATERLGLPNRDARVLDGYTLLGRKVDVVETSRGCTFDCSFCSIIEMRGRNFHPYPIDRVLADIADARAHGAEAIFLVDDNITLDVARFEALCRAIVDAGFNDTDYLAQAMTSPIAQHGARLAPLMKRAGFRYVFLGIENVLDDDLAFLRARAKNTRREKGRTVGNASIEAIEHLHRHGMYVVGGLIIGNPDDTVASIDANLAFARRYVDWPYIQHPTPYPGTPMTRDFQERGLIVDDDVSHYDGTTAVVRSEHVSAEEIEFRRWRAERWMKLRHFPGALRHSPLFVARHGAGMLAHTFAGSRLRSMVGLEDPRAVFARFRAKRRDERVNAGLDSRDSAKVGVNGTSRTQPAGSASH
ncbi:MAG: B12-binding domain-containing radical SAM protein [Acidobacteria bacterium]|nr:B12-binding domain-containing radical SAM protein [Acidobacteriota bacterium]